MLILSQTLVLLISFFANDILRLPYPRPFVESLITISGFIVWIKNAVLIDIFIKKYNLLVKIIQLILMFAAIFVRIFTMQDIL